MSNSKNVLVFAAITLGLVSGAASADIIKGTVKHFTGMTVETHQPYDYYALETVKKDRLLLPESLVASELSTAKAKVTLVASIDFLACTDMSDACPTGNLVNVKSVTIAYPAGHGKKEYVGKVAHLVGMAVEQPGQAYDYYAIKGDNKSMTSIPTGLNASVLEKLGATIKSKGKIVPMFCTDMSDACGPELLIDVSSVQVQF